MKKLLIFILIINLLLTGCQTNGELRDLKVQTAAELSILIKDLPKINTKTVYTYEEYSALVTNLNLLVAILNEKISSDFMPLSKDLDAYDKFMNKIDKYAPIINDYNKLIGTANNLNINDEENVNYFYVRAIILGGEITLISGSIFYGTAFRATGFLARSLGLTKMTKICSPCVSAAMSELHWFIRNTLTSALSSTLNKIAG